MMDYILDNCKGVIRIADDIIIHGKDDTEHDRRLHKFMKVTREHGVVMNKKKCEVKSSSVKFFECVYDKYRALQNIIGIIKCLWMITYLSPFILQLSSHTATLKRTAED